MGANASRNEIYNYAGRLMKVLNYPATVIPTHWDSFTIPYNAPQDDQLKQLESFKKEIKRVSPKTKIIVPKYFQPISFPVRRSVQ